VQCISSGKVSYKNALKVCLAIREFYPAQFRRFDEYYDFRITEQKEKK